MIEWNTLPLAQEHIHPSVDIHIKAFPNFFLSSLGPAFLYEFYSNFLIDKKGVGFVACDGNGTLLGVIVGPINPKGYFKRLLYRRWWAFSFRSLCAIVRKPSSALRLMRAILYRGNTPPGPPRALLSSIAVSPDAQASGIGKALVNEWTAEMKRRGAFGCYLTTDAEHNTTVNAFYLKLGWRIDSSFNTPEGRQMHYYIYDFK